MCGCHRPSRPIFTSSTAQPPTMSDFQNCLRRSSTSDAYRRLIWSRSGVVPWRIVKVTIQAVFPAQCRCRFRLITLERALPHGVHRRSWQ